MKGFVRGEGCYQEEIEKVFLTQKEFKDHLISKGTSHMKYHFCDVMNSYRRIYHREYNGIANMCIFFQFRQSTNSLKSKYWQIRVQLAVGVHSGAVGVKHRGSASTAFSRLKKT